jgi:DNA-binding MarR family transcriptional regulator
MELSMPAQPRTVDALIREIRANFARLRAVADALHRDLGLTAAQRAVVEFVFENGDHTVPQIARAKRVTRQHIQVLVDALVPAGMVELHDNPGHKRSPLVCLTDAGRRTFEAARAHEAALLAEIAGALDAPPLEAAVATLARLRTLLDHQLETGDDDD